MILYVHVVKQWHPLRCAAGQCCLRAEIHASRLFKGLWTADIRQCHTRVTLSTSHVLHVQRPCSNSANVEKTRKSELCAFKIMSLVVVYVASSLYHATTAVLKHVIERASASPFVNKCAVFQDQAVAIFADSSAILEARAQMSLAMSQSRSSADVDIALRLLHVLPTRAKIPRINALSNAPKIAPRQEDG